MSTTSDITFYQYLTQLRGLSLELSDWTVDQLYLIFNNSEIEPEVAVFYQATEYLAWVTGGDDSAVFSPTEIRYSDQVQKAARNVVVARIELAVATINDLDDAATRKKPELADTRKRSLKVALEIIRHWSQTSIQ